MYLAVLGALGIGLGTILRRTAGAIAALVGLLLILPILVNFLPSPWNTDIGKYLPLSAGNNVFHTAKLSSTDLSLWVGFAVFCAYAIASLAHRRRTPHPPRRLTAPGARSAVAAAFLSARLRTGVRVLVGVLWVSRGAGFGSDRRPVGGW